MLYVLDGLLSVQLYTGWEMVNQLTTGLGSSTDPASCNARLVSQVVEHILRNPSDRTQVQLVFGNVSEDDILLKDKIDALAAKHPDQFKVHYIVDKAKWGGIFWKGGVGYVTKDVVTKHLPTPGPDHLIMVCGPPPMMKAVSGDKAEDKSQGPLTGLLKDMGYTESMVYKF